MLRLRILVLTLVLGAVTETAFAQYRPSTDWTRPTLLENAGSRVTTTNASHSFFQGQGTTNNEQTPAEAAAAREAAAREAAAREAAAREAAARAAERAEREAARERAREERSRRRKYVKGHQITGGSIDFWNWPTSLDGRTSYMIPGRSKVADHNSAQPVDRAFFVFNHFKNANTSSLVGGSQRSSSIESYMIGLEKAFDRESTSIEFRLPLLGRSDYVAAEGFSTSGTQLGNVATIFKRVLYQQDGFTFTAGVSTSIPTGQDSQFLVGDDRLTIRNDSVHVEPFIAWLSDCHGPWWFQGFFQIDFAATGNEVEFLNILPGGTQTTAGRIRDQSMVCVDLQLGRWLYQGAGRRVTGLAAVVELHYLAALEDARTLTVFAPDTDFFIGNSRNRFDVLTMTGGMDLMLTSGSTIGFGVMVPLRDDDDRFFDVEMQATFTHFF